MSIFNIFKKKEIRQSAEDYKYSVEDILRIPQQKRDNSWRQSFLTAIVNIPLYRGLTETIENPYGMEYTNLETSTERHDIQPETFKSYVLKNIQTGLGITINGNKEEPDWAFTYGDLVDFYINEEFYSGRIKSPFGGGFVKDKYILKQEARVGQPSEIYLPLATRVVIRNFSNSFSISPKVCLILWVQTNELNLAFNIVPEMFANTDKDAFQSFLNLLGWFLPRHYQIISIQEDESFEPL